MQEDLHWYTYSYRWFNS